MHHTSTKVVMAHFQMLHVALHRTRCCPVACAISNVSPDLPDVFVVHVLVECHPRPNVFIRVPPSSGSPANVAVASLDILISHGNLVLVVLHQSHSSLSVVPRICTVAVGRCLHAASECHLCQTNPRGRKSEHWEKSYRSHG